MYVELKEVRNEKKVKTEQQKRVEQSNDFSSSVRLIISKEYQNYLNV